MRYRSASPSKGWRTEWRTLTESLQCTSALCLSFGTTRERVKGTMNTYFLTDLHIHGHPQGTVTVWLLKTKAQMSIASLLLQLLNNSWSHVKWSGLKGFNCLPAFLVFAWRKIKRQLTKLIKYIRMSRKGIKKTHLKALLVYVKTVKWGTSKKAR